MLTAQDALNSDQTKQQASVQTAQNSVDQAQAALNKAQRQLADHHRLTECEHSDRTEQPRSGEGGAGDPAGDVRFEHGRAHAA